MSNEASFHARITADAKQFVAEMQGAAAALATLVKQAESAGKVSTSGAKNEGAKAAREVQNVYNTARKEADKLHGEAMDQIKQENAERSKAPSRLADVVRPAGRRSRAEGPVRAPAGFAGAGVNTGLEIQDTAKLIGVKNDLGLIEQRNNLIAKSAFAESRRMKAEQIRMDRMHGQAIREDANRRAKIQQRELDAMVTGRYALYDQANGYDIVARKAMMLSAAMASTVVVAAQFESAFTSVERAMQPLPDEIESIRSSLLTMSQEMPIAFADMSKIATLGAQMGITASGIDEFTKNVAAFSAVTGSTIDETAQKFGRIAALANIDSTDFDKLGSAIAFTGINAVATEQEILALTESIAAATTNAGFAADETIGFATTLASLGIAPEQARGVVLRVFADITRAAETGGKKLENFGKIAGVSAEEAAKLWKSDPQAYFNKLLTGLGNVENFTNAMDALGFTETRETNVLQRLSQNMDIYNKSLTDSQKSYTDGSFLADAYAKTADNLDAKFQMLLNTLQSLADSIGSGLIGPLGVFVDAMKEVATASEKFFKTPFGQVITPLIVGMTAGVAALTAFKAVSLKATAQLFAMRTAMIQMGRAGDLASGGIKNSIMTMMGLQRAVEMSNGEIKFLTRSQYELAAAEGHVATTTKTGAVALNGWASQSKAAAVGTRIFSAALSTMGVVSAAAGIISIIATIGELNRVSMNLGESGGGLASFRDAMYEDTKAVANGATFFGQYKSKMTETSNVAKGYVSVLETVTGGQTTLNSNLSDVNEKITEQTIYLGQNSQAWLANALANDEAVQQMFKKMDESGKGAAATLREVGINFIEMEKAALAKPGTGALDYINKVSPKVASNIKDLVKGADAVSGGTKEGLKQVMEVIANSGNSAQATAAKMWLLAYSIDAVTKEGVRNSKNMELLGVQFPDLSDSAEDLTKDLGGTAKAIRTVTDYASDLAGIFGRVQEIRFGRKEALDNIAKGWNNIAEKAADASKAIEDANAATKEAEADKAILQYQLSVAQRYGDEKRALVIRAKLAKVDQKIADETEKKKEAQDKLSMSTKGNTNAAIENRATLLSIFGSYQALIEVYAKTGLKGKALQDKITELSGKFADNAREAGFAESDIASYGKAFDDLKVTVEKTPRNVDVEFKSNASAATQAVSEYISKLKSSEGTYNAKLNVSGLEKLVLLARIQSLQALIANGQQQLSKNDLNAEGRRWLGAGLSSAGSELAKLQAQVKGMATGGLVTGYGTSTSDSIPTMLSNGEYVMRASAVSAYGPDFMNAINQQKLSMAMPMGSNAAPSSSSSQVVYLSPDDRALLRAAIDRPVNLYTDNQKIAASANAGNVILAQRGSN